jgi:hypothetical protein
MGQPVSVIEKPTGRVGVLRFETNRNLTGMGHERYSSAVPVEGERPADVLARRLFDHGGVTTVHVYGGIITVELAPHAQGDGIKEIIEDLYTFYRPDAPAGAL